MGAEAATRLQIPSELTGAGELCHRAGKRTPHCQNSSFGMSRIMGDRWGHWGAVGRGCSTRVRAEAATGWLWRWAEPSKEPPSSSLLPPAIPGSCLPSATGSHPLPEPKASWGSLGKARGSLARAQGTEQHSEQSPVLTQEPGHVSLPPAPRARPIYRPRVIHPGQMEQHL